MIEYSLFFQSVFGVLVMLVIKHWVADFVLQTPSMIEGKGTYGNPFGILHSLIHGALTALIFLLAGISPIVTAVSIGIYDMLIHYHIDWAKMQFKSDTNSPKFWALLGLDQMLHHLTYIGIVFWFFIVSA